MHYLYRLTFNFLPVFPSMTPSSLASTIVEVSTSPLPLQSIKSVIFGCPLTVFYKEMERGDLSWFTFTITDKIFVTDFLTNVFFKSVFSS